ncbi:RelA/SpoT family protein [Umboniibacter marinipuniceus]|uniref:guanosine-3',5'-bis(diphosphate) 3'-diphosphatase n=1 Tax=Umboniibacter marinipuniceus TaxID=569599 RepID=A0A3M0AH18_9GAMM|nr:bifunctional (p)ppGpp synthetase/guanosine-3',5'-bis(diphosphate) 3'-pyrophosphohydrolase [Umboniibacter marinipuniceus]RMA82068.1 RelA/SpoT family (p)ppGpp synthetase [Umboniibacter marinipuniceus]
MSSTLVSDKPITIDELTDKLENYLPAERVQSVRRAYFYAQQAHDGQTRRSGEPYVTHPLAVANILADMHMDPESLMAAMLHDVIEDTGIPKDALSQQFGGAVADLVDGVSKLTQIEFSSRAEMQAENFQKMAMAMARDIRVILVKLADRLHNMRTLGALKPEKGRRIARETLDIYAPIAHRLGMNDIRLELEDRGFYAMHPVRATRIDAAIRSVRGNRNEIVSKITDALQQCLQREGHEVMVSGREKHLWSIYQKMKSKHKSFTEIMDVYAFRIVTQSVDQCYRVLGCIHNLYKPVPGAFKEYIAIPKTNGYQSLHTVLIGMHGVPIEVQIRTAEMDTMANHGIASHSLYKTSDEDDLAPHTRARDWVQGLLQLQQQAGNPLEFIEHVKVDLFPDEVYVFTPKGKIIELPQGATAVDFAYAVHTGVGDRCVAARINNRLSPLSQVLESGQHVQIITSPGGQPNPAWLDFVATGKARSAIRHFLKTQRVSESVVLGKRMLNRTLQAYQKTVDEIDPQEIQRVLEQHQLADANALFEEIGLGNHIPFVMAQQLMATSAEGELKDVGEVPLLVSDSEGMVMSFAGCCRPIPGDQIIGRISPGKGVVVHRDDCHNLNEVRGKSGELTPVAWSGEVTGEYLADIRVEVENIRGVFASLAALLAEEGGNIDRVDIAEKDAGYAIINLTVGVKSRVHLASILRRVHRKSWVLKSGRKK